MRVIKKIPITDLDLGMISHSLADIKSKIFKSKMVPYRAIYEKDDITIHIIITKDEKSR